MRLFSAARSDAARIDAQGDSVRPNISEERERGGGVRPGEGAVAPNGHGPVSGPPEKQALQKKRSLGIPGRGERGRLPTPPLLGSFRGRRPGIQSDVDCLWDDTLEYGKKSVGAAAAAAR